MENVIKNKVRRVFLISVFTGLIISIVEYVSIYFMAKGTNEWTTAMGDTVFWIDIIIAGGLFFTTGLFCFRGMGKMDIIKSATIVVLYYIVVVALEQLLLYMGQYPSILLWLFIPVRLYSAIHQVFLRLTGMSVWICLFPGIMAPYLYVLFGKREFDKEN